MRTASEILFGWLGFTLKHLSNKSLIISAINEARKESIEESAKISSKYIISNVGTAAHIEEEILSLINELK